MTKTESSMPWLDRLLAAPDVASLHTALSQAHPAFGADALRRCAIVGASSEGVRFAGICAERGIEVVAIADDNPELQGGTVADRPVISSEGLLQLDHDLAIVVASHRGHGARERLRQVGFKHVELLSLIQVISPQAFPPHMFFQNWLESTFASRERIARLAARLGDDISRRTLDGLIAFRLTVDPAVLVPVADLNLYGPGDLFQLGEDEVYVDGGTFDGDSIRWFIDRCNGKFERVLGFEPDPRTFKRLAENFRGEPRVEPINKGLWSRTEVLRFVDDASRGAILGDQGTITVPVTSLDEVMQGGRVTYIKMNIEGAEIEALHGARETITKWKPRMAISLYHRPDDLWAIPQEIDAIRPDYRLFLRQQDIGVIETVLYALP